MTKETLLQEIERQKAIMVEMAKELKDPFSDPVVYKKSCEIDQLIVALLKGEYVKDDQNFFHQAEKNIA